LTSAALRTPTGRCTGGFTGNGYSPQQRALWQACSPIQGDSSIGSASAISRSVAAALVIRTWLRKTEEYTMNLLEDADGRARRELGNFCASV
jgi:hypothetical protein